ncbi:MAG: type IV secretion system protein [Myxococcota bacterium]|jgi:type IV secretion system protein VirB6
MANCPAFDPLGPYLTGMVRFVDCHSRALGEAGYQALGAGSPIAAAIGGLVVIYIALIGYRMVLGEIPGVRDGVLAVVRIGAVLTLALEWPAYQVLIYGIAVDEPGSLALRILSPGGLGGDDPDALVVRLQSSYDALDTLAHPETVQQPTPQPSPTPSATGAAAVNPVEIRPAAPPRQILALPLAQLTSLASAEALLATSVLGGLLSTRIIAGLLLALGPVFAACLLFEVTMGLFIGWLRTLFATVVGAVGVCAVLSLELAILPSQLAALQQAIADGLAVPTLAGEIVATTMLFAVLIVAVLIGAVMAAVGLRAPAGVRRVVHRTIEHIATGQPPSSFATLLHSARPVPASTSRTRAQLLASALEGQDRSEEQRGGSAGARQVSDRLAPATGNSHKEPIGQVGRRLSSGHSASARRRDKR